MSTNTNQECHICGKPASLLCSVCGRPACSEDIRRIQRKMICISCHTILLQNER